MLVTILVITMTLMMFTMMQLVKEITELKELSNENSNSTNSVLTPIKNRYLRHRDIDNIMPRRLDFEDNNIIEDIE
jgi:hypothetical protein